MVVAAAADLPIQGELHQAQPLRAKDQETVEY
jgi:hypothetical protein